MKTAVSPTWWHDQRWQGWLRLLQGVLEIQSFNIPRYKTDLQNVGKRSKDPFHVLPEGRKTEPGASGRRRNACVLPRGDHCLALQRRDGESPQVHRQQQRLREAPLPPSNAAQEHSQLLQRSTQQHHTDFQGVWYSGLNSTASQSHTPNPAGAGEGSTAAPEGQEKTPALQVNLHLH